MSTNIAIAEKGDTGKTTVTSLVIRYLKDNDKGPILAVDADPNANLGEGDRHAASWISPVGARLNCETPARLRMVSWGIL